MNGIRCPLVTIRSLSVENFLMSIRLQITRIQSTKLSRVEELQVVIVTHCQ